MMTTFPAGMAENAPKDSAYIGPTDPTGNPWLPAELMIMGIPIALAQQMAADLDQSFICKRSKIGYPENRSKERKLLKHYHTHQKTSSHPPHHQPS